MCIIHPLQIVFLKALHYKMALEHAMEGPFRDKSALIILAKFLVWAIKPPRSCTKGIPPKCPYLSWFGFRNYNNLPSDDRWW